MAAVASSERRARFTSLADSISSVTPFEAMPFRLLANAFREPMLANNNSSLYQTLNIWVEGLLFYK